MDALDMENVKLKPRPRKPRKSQPLRPIALPSVAQGLEHPPRAGGDYDVALAPAIPPPAIHAPVGLAPAAYEIFDPDYRIIPPEEQAIGEQLSIIVEVKPFIDGINHPYFNIVQNCYHNSNEMIFHVKIILRQGFILCIVVVYLIFKEDVEIYASQKSLNEVAETVLKITLAVFAGLGAIYGVLAGSDRYHI
ncbi:hypothetical protein TWF191_000279 [Orbilia oligospora]|uniref:Uncharacterized protein n=1 Tax=Orbilia oligospora TaxID=2813651 RepID=A0A7C8V7J3_ORBOL|nr:hypothetical protein TWF191_000279 [Orbilia oligospora]